MPKGDEICFPNPTVKTVTDLDLDAQVVIRTSVKLVRLLNFFDDFMTFLDGRQSDPKMQLMRLSRPDHFQTFPIYIF